MAAMHPPGDLHPEYLKNQKIRVKERFQFKKMGSGSEQKVLKRGNKKS